MGGAHGMGMASSTMENLPKSQASKDATMAYFILENCFFNINSCCIDIIKPVIFKNKWTQTTQAPLRILLKNG